MTTEISRSAGTSSGPQTASCGTCGAGGFLLDLERSVADVRSALLDLIASVEGLPRRPLPMARHLGLDKNLAWKATRIVRAADASEVVRHLPGPAGLKRIVDACARLGADAGAVAAVEAAIERFDRMVDRHAGDRASLELILASGDDVADAQGREHGRKLAFQGQSVVCGVQARVRFGLQLAAPSAVAQGRVDVAAIGGLIDFRRLRASAAWPLLSVARYADDVAPREEPLSGERDGLPLLRDFSSDPLPEIREVREPAGSVYELAGGPVGRAAASTCAFGWITRGIGALHGAPGDVAEFMLAAETPAETLVFDLLIHRDLAFAGPPRHSAWSTIHGPPRYPLARHARYALPIGEPLEDLGRPANVAHELLPRHAELVAFACERAGFRASDFRGTRLVLRYPPVPAIVVQSLPLA